MQRVRTVTEEGLESSNAPQRGRAVDQEYDGDEM
jgi:hypothetical protein